MSKQRMLLQEQVQKWAEENSASVGVSDNEEDDDKLFDEESAQKENKKKGGSSKGKKGKGRKRKEISLMIVKKSQRKYN